MRIIAGKFRSRVLSGPEGRETTRPITDRVKQSLFDIVTPLLPGAVVYDCFAGTGSMGLESLSRGARRAIFFESDRSALARLKKNIEALGVEAESSIISTDIFRHFDGAGGPPQGDEPSVIFFDPPYRFVSERPDLLGELARRLGQRLAPDGVFVFRRDAKDRLELPSLTAVDERQYGSMILKLYRGNPQYRR
jgi:16S rRNA (guanine966-N2)-methyltransferase